jgi:hypothetical protein
MKAHLERIVAPVVLCVLLAGCAQTGPPLPPSLELPKAPTDLRASRKGNRVTLSWSEPTLTTDRKSVRYLGPTFVCRSADSEIAACGNPAATLLAPAAAPQKPRTARHAVQQPSSPRPASQTYTNTLPANMQSQDPSAEITYAVEVLNRNARSAGLSNRVHVPAVVTLPPPGDLAATLTGDGVVLTWTSAGEPQYASGHFSEISPDNSSAHSPGLEFRYRIYRRDESSGKDAIAGEVPVGEAGSAHFTDSGLEWENTYLYRITAVSVVKRADSEVQVEGDDTSPVRVIAHDVFPPNVPVGLQAAYSGEGQKPFIDLIWAPVTNADLAGYNVYRSETNTGKAKTEGKAEVTTTIKLNSALVKSPAYRDSAVASGKTYTYAVSAVDVRGNESQRSEATSEPVP